MARAKRTKLPYSVTYQWRDGFRHPRGLGALEVGEELDKIRRTYGELQAEHVVSEARRPGSMLHEAFEWDDSVAAEEYRKEQARYLIQSIRIVTENGGRREMPYAISVVTGEGREYVPTLDLFSDRQWRLRALQTALMEAEQWRARYMNLEELARVFDMIEQARGEIDKLVAAETTGAIR